MRTVSFAIALSVASISATGAEVVTTVGFVPSSAEVANPERGFSPPWSLGSDPSSVRARAGATLLRSFENLAAYINGDLPDRYLAELNSNLARLRAAKLKTTLRFKYNNGEGYPQCVEATKQQMLRHISQLAPVLNANADVIVLLEAGFIGCWGEWSGSSQLKNPNDEAELLKAMLDAVPSRPVTLRSPGYKAAIYDAPTPMTVAEALSGSNRSRTGYFNDCLLSTNTDQDLTYPLGSVRRWMDYVVTESAWLPLGGETCGNRSAPRNGRSGCNGVIGADGVIGQAQSVLAKYHVTYLNPGDVVQADWKAQGCYDEIAKRLGYRLRLETVSYSSEISSGGSLSLAITLVNDGYAAPVNPRPVIAVLDGNSRRYEWPMGVDPRQWAGQTVQSFNVNLSVPASITPGTYRLSLWLPDAAPSLRRNPFYAIRMANDGIWDEQSGFNVITTQLSVKRGQSIGLEPGWRVRR